MSKFERFKRDDATDRLTNVYPPLKFPEEIPKTVKDTPGGLKYDDEKPPLALIPPEAEEEEARVWGYGARKYGLHNFRKGIAYTRILSAMRRHTAAIIRGEDRDPETGFLHAAHVRCCAGMLIVLKDRKDLDDRFTAIDKLPKTT